MKATFTWDGLTEFKQAMRNLPNHLAIEAATIVNTAATGAAAEIRNRYPVKTGNLRRGVQVRIQSKPGRAVALLQNTAPHAFIYESGTQARHYSGTDKLGRRYVMGSRGSMPPGHVFWPVYYARRRQMFDQLKTMLQREGLLVSGEAA